MSGVEVVFAAFALLAWTSGLLAVTSRRVVHAALWLVVALGALAGVYLTLGAQVVALVQLLVYVGAVVVLVLFALMLTRAPIGLHSDLDGPPGQRLAAAGAGIAVAALIGGTLYAAVQDTAVTPDLARGSALPLGRAIFSSWVLPFELLSLLLLAALVAALAISRGDRSSGDRWK
jgi:NADH-quinone oxidoreductase subunit J